VLASYHLEVQPTTFDFATWLVTAQTRGVTEISLVGDKFKKKRNYPDEVARARLENIVKPLVELSGLKTVQGEGPYYTHFMRGVFAAYREHSRIWKFPYEQKHDHITVTLRSSFRNKARDSNRAEWDKFITWAENKGEKVVVIEDAEKGGISIKDRWDAYQCRLNLFTGGGPSVLCMFSDAPYVTFFKGLMDHDYYLNCVHHWLWTGTQFPWAGPKQAIAWKEDRFDDIVRYYERFATSGAH
jgi:hypothetical protein